MKKTLFDENGIVRVSNVNALAQNCPETFISLCEDYYNDQIKNAVGRLLSDEKYKIVLIAGPSGSGKTTTAKKIAENIALNSKNAMYISLDDFFLNRDDLPKLENGDTDFESVNTLDIAEIRKCFGLLLSGKCATVPYFDFVSGKREAAKARKVEAGKDDIIIVEGLHALNPKLTDGIEAFGDKGFFRVFVNPEHQISDDNGDVILRRRNLRLMRRMIRDYNFRGSSLVNTLNMWEGVYNEEIKTILPLKETADVIIDTNHFYEPCIYHHFLLPIIEKSHTDNSDYLEILGNLAEKLDEFYDISLDYIPSNSMIREFIGEK